MILMDFWSSTRYGASDSLRSNKRRLTLVELQKSLKSIIIPLKFLRDNTLPEFVLDVFQES